jgi:molecular chaperone DnaK (HSP70)
MYMADASGECHYISQHLPNVKDEGGLSRKALPRLEAMDNQPSPIYTLHIQVPVLDTGNQILRTTEDS